MPVEEAREWLRTLPAVGPKTAACVLLFGLGMPGLPVDTHVFRVASRLALIDERLARTNRRPTSRRRSRRRTTSVPHPAHPPWPPHLLRPQPGVRAVPAAGWLSLWLGKQARLSCRFAARQKKVKGFLRGHPSDSPARGLHPPAPPLKGPSGFAGKRSPKPALLREPCFALTW